MERTITLAVDVGADPGRVFEVLSTTAGQRAFWTDDCDVSPERARFGFAIVPIDLEVDVHLENDRSVQMTVTSGFPFWEGSTWEWQIDEATEAGSGSTVLFRHYRFGDGYSESALGHTAQSWAMILDRLARYLESGTPQPFFTAAA